MHPILEKLLRKRGIENPAELSPEEKQTFEGWNLVLNKDELTTDDIRKFCQGQISAIETKWAELDRDAAKKAQLIPYHTVYKMLLSAINSPRSAREALEQQLNQMLNL